MLNLFQHRVLTMSQQYYVYILGNNNLTLYIGVTSNLETRIYQHKKKLVKGFTKKYSVNKLLYYEVFGDIEKAIKREKQLKNWHRDWKLNQIRSQNPNFEDLYKQILK